MSIDSDDTSWGPVSVAGCMCDGCDLVAVSGVGVVGGSGPVTTVSGGRWALGTEMAVIIAGSVDVAAVVDSATMGEGCPDR